jgi:sensor histidine kinase YesM
MFPGKLLSKKIVYHTLFWLACWVLLSIEDYAYYPYLLRNFKTNLINTLLFIPAIYLNLYILIPALLQKKKYWQYTFLSVVIIAAIVVVANQLQYISIRVVYYKSVQAFIAVGTELLTLYIFTTVLKFIQNYYRSQTTVKELSNKNLEMELGLLKSQVNPHFLFNTLNNLYFLINKKPAQAQEVVLKLSDLLSHQLYDNTKEQIELKKEVENLRNYIELEKIRNQDSVLINYEFPANLNGERIAPMLLLPLIENAFKHGNTSATKTCFINCSLDLHEHVLHFHCENSFQNNATVKENSGIGLYNVKRRLELLYPNSHEFNVLQSDSIYQLNLTINLDEN